MPCAGDDAVRGGRDFDEVAPGDLDRGDFVGGETYKVRQLFSPSVG